MAAAALAAAPLDAIVSFRLEEQDDDRQRLTSAGQLDLVVL